MSPVAPHPESDGIRGPEGDATPVALRPAITPPAHLYNSKKPEGVRLLYGKGRLTDCSRLG